MPEQIPFDLTPDPNFTFDNFHVGKSNRDVYMAITSYPNWPAPVILMTGPAGCGKSHLGQAWQVKFDGGLFVDDIDHISEDDLFGLINRALNGDVPALLLAGRTAPDQRDLKLSDLRSRFNYIPHFAMDEPDDDILEPVIRKLFEDKGRTVKADTVRFICARFERSVPAMSVLVSELDAAAGSAKKDVTKAFVAEFLKRAGR